MKTDRTRNTFVPQKHFSTVRLKQGAMQLDADWNEQIDILGMREETALIDITGQSGVPIENGGFRIIASAADLTPKEQDNPKNKFTDTLAAGDVLVTAGRAYVDGKQIVNEMILPLSAQPDLPGHGVLPGPGVHLIYLDVWERTITSLEDGDIREVALGGPDTATRTRRIWQVRTMPVNGPLGDGANCMNIAPEFEKATLPSTGRMAARAEPDPAASGPCIVPESAGYRSLENQLYRVECIQAGNRTTARFVWSRENGSVVTKWLGKNGPELTVSSTGPDRKLGFANGDWVELIDEGRELRGEPGTLVRVLAVRDNVLEIDPATATGSVDFAQFPSQPRIRRWDSDGVFAANGMSWVPLEQGVEVRFAAGTYEVGDFWTIPARTNSNDVEWPRSGGGSPDLVAPEGITHHYARLALVNVSGNNVTEIMDCRPLFPPLSGLTQIDYVGGDGQEAMPDLTNPNAGVPLPEPLQVAVSRGGYPIAGARVAFTVASGNGQVNGSNTANVLTDAEGIARVDWRLGRLDQPQRVEARLDLVTQPTGHVPVRFSASYETASDVAVDPANCPDFQQQGVRTVQQALDVLCARSGGGEEPGFRIQRIIWQNGQDYQHDGVATQQALVSGLRIVCDALVDPETIHERPVVYLSLFENRFEVGWSEIRIDADLKVDANDILWSPRDPNQLQAVIEEIGSDRYVLELTIRGNNIRALGDDGDRTEIWLDAEGIELPGAKILPSGDTRRGGTLKSWFRLGEGFIEPTSRPEFREVSRGGISRLSGFLVDSETGKGIEGATVVLAGQDQAADTIAEGRFSFSRVPAGPLLLIADTEIGQAQISVPALIRNADPLRAGDIRPVVLSEIDGLSANLRKKLINDGLTNPLTIANLDEPTLKERLSISDAQAKKLIKLVRDALRPE